MTLLASGAALHLASLQARQRSRTAVVSSAVIATMAALLLVSGSAPVAVVVWAVFGMAALVLRLRGVRLAAQVSEPAIALVERQRLLAAGLCGLIVGAAATLFLPSLSMPARVAQTLLACAALAAAIADFGDAGRPFRLFTALSIGQFALAWWRLPEPGDILVAAALAGFAIIAAVASRGVERLGEEIASEHAANESLLVQLEDEHRRAIQADREKSRFIAAASHDLRQPAAALSLTSALLRDQNVDQRLAPALDGLDRSVRAMNEMLDQMLDLSRLDNGQVAVELRQVEIDAMLADLARELRPRALQAGLAVTVRGCGRIVECDPLLVGRVLRNLLDNALRHTAQGGVTLAAEVDANDRLVLSVSDTGCGIDAEHHARLFDEHYQVGNKQRSRAHGLGIGLAIVRRIARLHRIEIELDSAPGRGSTFRLVFLEAAHRADARARVETRNAHAAAAVEVDHHPLLRHDDRNVRRAGLLPRGDAAAVEAPDPDTRCRVLIVEDDEALASAFEAWFVAAGCDVRMAVDAAAALHVLDGVSFCPELVISDYRLPGDRDGLAVLCEASRLVPTARRVLVSGDIDPALPALAAQEGVALLRKPIEAHALAALLPDPLG